MIFRGRAGHAGTVPMNLRQDALAGAAEWVGTVEDLARRRPPLLATVGTVAVRPGAPNVIPAEVTLSLDLRHPRDAARRAALRVVRARARAIGRRRNLSVHWEPTQDDDAVACDPQLTRIMAAATRAVQGRAPVLVSGAGHDAVVLAAQMPIALLFVRCRAGLSHHPDEFASPADIRTALDVLCGALRHLAATIP
jgi:allantoate deiminase